MKINLFLVLALASPFVFAAGKGPASLISNGVNVFLFLALIVYLASKKLPSFFNEKSENVSEMINRAESKAKEAQLMMEAQKKKTSGLNSEIDELQKDSEKLISEFETKYVSDVNERIEKLKEDAGQKIEAEKVEMLHDLNEDLLNLVINNAKAKIKANDSLAKSATENIIKGL